MEAAGLLALASTERLGDLLHSTHSTTYAFPFLIIILTFDIVRATDTRPRCTAACICELVDHKDPNSTVWCVPSDIGGYPVLTIYPGEHSPKTDEWCITYCTQTVRGRITSQQPGCRSLCVRRVFAHEVRNILAFRRHQDTDDDGKAKYPLPAEGQPVNVPRFLGGKPPDPDADHPVPIPPKKYWDEGWYLWTTKSTHASVEKLATMNFDLQRQARRESYKEKRRATWQEYEQFLENNQTDSPEGSKWWGAIVPPRPFPDTQYAPSLLVTFNISYKPQCRLPSCFVTPTFSLMGPL